MKHTEREWGKIFDALEAWRGEVLKNSGELTAVSEVSASHKRDPWAILVSTVLSLRTKDEVTLKTSRALLADAPDAASLLRLTEEKIAGLAYPAGFYRTKAKNLLKIAQIIEEKYGGNVPDDMDALLALPGVGRKTANLVITEAFGLYGICVDTHVHRISNRAGWVQTKNPEQTEMELREILPKEFWLRINDLLVQYGQKICRPISPFCSKCVIREQCERVNVEKFR
jgi:endonuclease-3